VKRSAAQRIHGQVGGLARLVRQTQTALVELMARDFAELSIKEPMLDGEHMAERCVVVALGIAADGTKIPVGLWDGSTANKTVVRALLADLVERGLAFDDGLLVVLNGAKTLSAAVREVFADKALIQRCTLPTACTGPAWGQDRSSSPRCGRSVLTPALTQCCLPGGRKPAKPLLNNLLTHPAPTGMTVSRLLARLLDCEPVPRVAVGPGTCSAVGPRLPLRSVATHVTRRSRGVGWCRCCRRGSRRIRQPGS
jgi:Transposase, Mutator family